MCIKQNRETLGRSRRCAPHPGKPWRPAWTGPTTAEVAFSPLPGLHTAEVMQLPRILTVPRWVPPAAAQAVLHAHGHAHHQATVLVATGMRGPAACRGRHRVRRWRGILVLQRLRHARAMARIMQLRVRVRGAAGLHRLGGLQLQLLRRSCGAAQLPHDASMQEHGTYHTPRDMLCNLYACSCI